MTLSVPRPAYASEEQRAATIYRAAQPTGGLVYLDVQVLLPSLSDEQLELLPFYAFAVTRNGAGDLDEVELTRRIEAVTGGISGLGGQRQRPGRPRQHPHQPGLQRQGLVAQRRGAGEL